jgi:predicted phage baseplate assembly protein
MSLPQVELDDRRFQDLVNEARTRVARACPEWSEHNVSDPGITLIELFAWMTDMLVYRLNRVPDKLHVALLELLGITLAPPAPAATDVRLRLAAAAVEPVRVPAWDTEVGTIRTPREESIVFQTSADFTIPALKPKAYMIEHDGAAHEIPVGSGVARPRGGDQAPFAAPPVPGDALYLGFDQPLARLVIGVSVECSQARGAGVDPEDPPLRWEYSTGEGVLGWREATLLADHTGGFNYGSGVVELELPAQTGQATVGERKLHWIRCRVDPFTRAEVAAAYTLPPEIYSITAGAIGARIPAMHATRRRAEVLGESDGTPGQTFRLRYGPALALQGDETLEVLPPRAQEWERWQVVDSFSESGADDPHFLFDAASGEVHLGTAVNAGDGSWQQYGRVPPKGALLRMSGYRSGGGRRGNLAPGTLTVLKSSIPGVASATNPVPATGGVDGETLDDARRRAPLQLRTRYRAVTADDFEALCREASRQVARVFCIPPDPDDALVRLRLLPMVEDSARKLSVEELTPGEELLAQVAAHLDPRRMVGTRVHLAPVPLRGVSVVCDVQAALGADPGRVEADIERMLYTYLNPLVGGNPHGMGTGWEFGRALNQGELFGVVHQVPGVEFVKILRVYETDLVTGKQDPKPLGSHLEIAAHELVASGTHIVKAEHREL